MVVPGGRARMVKTVGPVAMRGSSVVVVPGVLVVTPICLGITVPWVGLVGLGDG
ncbi:hypothetical protein DE4576_05555 [Mycobacterium marinum]|uniref:Uncharacterized protein n=1 Tax=Mycobacterium marinum TaxID=1781 RepID=A0A3E2MV85_MYCMR|nr:hypothetical protein DAVIS_02885 [Mycobacterium marinum]RFZ60438.1 hypothetical protein DE4576_05555 [Mycobacterium marinum]